MADFADDAILEQYFDDIESDFDGWVLEKSQIVQCCLREQPPFPSVHRICWANPIFARTRLYFDEYETISVSADEVDFAAS